MKQYSLIDIDSEYINPIAHISYVRDTIINTDCAIEDILKAPRLEISIDGQAQRYAYMIKIKTATKVSLKRLTENTKRALEVLNMNQSINVEKCFEILADIVSDAMLNSANDYSSFYEEASIFALKILADYLKEIRRIIDEEASKKAYTLSTMINQFEEFADGEFRNAKDYSWAKKLMQQKDDEWKALYRREQ